MSAFGPGSVDPLEQSLDEVLRTAGRRGMQFFFERHRLEPASERGGETLRAIALNR